ncbi:MAG TPA: hypothetical protein VIF60_01245 [Burkholderiaceae bacterium]|jgi:hypothetical protein
MVVWLRAITVGQVFGTPAIHYDSLRFTAREQGDEIREGGANTTVMDLLGGSNT